MAERGSLAKSRRRQEQIARTIAYVVLTIGAGVILLPFVFMVSTSLKERDKAFTRELELFPVQVNWTIEGERYRVFVFSEDRTAEDLGLPVPDASERKYAIEIPGRNVGAGNVAVVALREMPEGPVPEQEWKEVIVSRDDLEVLRTFEPKWSNYKEALTPPNFRFMLYLRNTLIITFAALIGQVISCSLVAFGFARLRFPGRNVLFIMVLATMMLPPQVTMVPLFKIFVTLGWYDTFLPLTVPAFFATSGFFVFLLRQYFMGIPLEMDEAARIDGASNFGIFYRVLLPQAKPAVATVAIFSFMAHWNDFLGPLIYLGKPELRTLALGLYAFQGEHSIDIQLLMAAATVVMLPLLILFTVAQRYFIQGVVISGVKG